MNGIRIESVSPPLNRPALASRVAAALRRADAMGLLKPTAKPVVHLDLPMLRQLLAPVQAAGIATSALTRLADMRPPQPEGPLAKLLDDLQRSLLESPQPTHEWPRLSQVLGLDLLGRLVGAAPVSARRYAQGERETPLTVADRLHHIAMIVGDLAGAYNDLGIRLWFDRPRKLLGGKAPAALLAGDWRSDEQGPQRVLELAESLAGSPAT